MAKFELKLPKMGESVAEATITSWLKEVGDTVELDEAIVEIATDKVDSEVPSEVEGTLVEILFEKDAIVAVGQTIAVIETNGGEETSNQSFEENEEVIERISNGEQKLIGFLVGQVIKLSNGKVNPSVAKELLLKEIEQ